ncbi:MAG: Tex family protein [Bacilli bacterium]
MNEEVIKNISLDLNIRIEQVKAVLELLEEGNTIPFIARYRKERTNGVDEEVIRKINDIYVYSINLIKRKDDIIRLIDEKGLLTEELKSEILKCDKLALVEEIYRPFKEHKKTKATDAINNGLKPLAELFLKFPTLGDINYLCKDFINDKVKNIDEAITGVKYIIAEEISDNLTIRKEVRKHLYLNGTFSSTLKKKAVDENMTYKMYYDYKESVNTIKPHRVLALNRGEKEGILTVNIEIDNDSIINYIVNKVILNSNSYVTKYIIESINDSYKRLIFPSVERLIRSELKEMAEDTAIDNFSVNVEKLLLTPPIKGRVVLGLDPAFRTGCKLAVLDPTGKVLDISVIFPNEPRNDIENSKKHVLELIKKYNVDIIAIGNGTASRESENFVVDVIKESSRHVEYIIVSEAGASVYSASKLAIEEFPDLHVEERSAISIGRRLQDSLSELVKIDPKSIGVGLYQHDVNEKKLDERLDFVVEKTVNRVGVNINTASVAILKHVSGLTKKAIEGLITTREELGKISNRLEIKKIKGITPKVFEQSIGFIRVMDGDNILDKTSIHPEQYKNVEKLFKILKIDKNNIDTTLLDNIDEDSLIKELNIDKYTFKDIVLALKTPGRDLRDDMDKPILRSDILSINDLKVGDKLQGTVRNVVDFGVFIDIGIKNDALAHISKLTNKYIKHPSEILGVGDIVECFVDEIFLDKKKVSLTLVKNN